MTYVIELDLVSQVIELTERNVGIVQHKCMMSEEYQYYMVVESTIHISAWTT